MKYTIFSEIVAPMARRMGTALTAFLGGAAVVDPTIVETAVLGVLAAGLVGFDLVASHFARRREDD